MLVDTSVWIDYFNGYTFAPAQRLADAIASNQPITLCGIVLTEILLGLKSEADANRIASLLDAFKLTPKPDRQDYLQAAFIYWACRTQGTTIRSTIDCIVAQVCLRHSLTLLTKDRDFAAITQHFPLRLVVNVS